MVKIENALHPQIVSEIMILKLPKELQNLSLDNLYLLVLVFDIFSLHAPEKYLKCFTKVK